MHRFLISVVRGDFQRSPRASSPASSTAVDEADRTMDVDTDENGSDRDEDTDSGELKRWTSTASENLIPKPVGEAGKSGSGGYNLERVMELHGVDKRQFGCIRVGIQIFSTSSSC